MAFDEKHISRPGTGRFDVSNNDNNNTAHAADIEGEFITDPDLERRITRKCDLKILPPLMILFMVTFIDRTNIANAKIEGMTTELKMKNNDYNMSLWILNIPYICLALPSNILMKKGFVRPAVYLSGQMFSLCTIGLGVTKSFKGVLVCRFLMGCFEAGFVPGCAYLISRYYKRREFTVRYAFFFSASALAGAFGGLLAFAIRNMKGVGGYAGWRWIFIIEGLMTVVTALIGIFCIPDYPDKSTFLKPEEKGYLLKMLRADAGPSRPNHYNFIVVKECLLDPKIWLGTISYFGADTAASSIVSFQPTILKGLGYSSAQAQVHTIPVYIVALILLNITSYLSGRLRHRYSFLVFAAILGIIGWSIELAVPITSIGARYFGIFAITACALMQMPILVVWISNNMGGNAKAAFAIGFMIGFGNCGNLVSSNVFITNQSPTFRTGFGTGLALTVVGLLSNTAMEIWLWVKNRRRDAGREDAKLDSDRGILGDLGDDHPGFRYIL
ncbi:related to putative tartrate transporter [Phialocephala subalpina]|uniref:Related to putative tartrate transporter n=1 Tax=Phialocephala subalpina TaxID=576137 RepID=A0A1L7XW65_9HELO|nr:related to putative tartrate transporter [Phialocephala subalpina]